jgi:hypothetical protein
MSGSVSLLIWYQSGSIQLKLDGRLRDNGVQGQVAGPSAARQDDLHRGVRNRNIQLQPA